MKAMRCQALVLTRHYSAPGQCLKTKNVKMVRWAPTPLTTRIIKGLCTVHKKKLEEGKLALIK
jgi:hypothetical protein